MKEEKEAFIESLYLQYAGKLERASLNYERHAEGCAVYRGMAVQGLPGSADDGAEHLPKTAKTACAAGG